MLGLTYLGEILLSHIGGKRASVVIRSYRMFVGLWVQIYILTTNPPFLSLSLLSPLEWNLLKITSEDCVEAHWSASLGQCCTISLGSTCSARLRGRRSSIQMLTETSFTWYMWTSLRKLQFWFESWCTDCLVAVSSSLPVIVWGEHCCILETNDKTKWYWSELSARKQMSRYSFNISENLTDTWLLRQMMMLILE